MLVREANVTGDIRWKEGYGPSTVSASDSPFVYLVCLPKICCGDLPKWTFVYSSIRGYV